MIKISFWICGTCLVAWVIFVGVICVIESSPPSSEYWGGWGIISGITAGLAIASFALSYLGGHIIRRSKGAIRLGVLISVLWVVGHFVASEPGSRFYGWTNFFVFGIIPVILYWGIIWVISGFLPSKNKMENS